MAKKQLTGKVISAKMQKTCVVEVESMKVHPKYKKRYLMHESYKAHSENNEYKEGDRVIIEESRPLSKDKRWIIIGKTTNSK